MNSIALIIPAAGTGERLDEEVPKPFIEVAGKTILEHTIARFMELPDVKQVIVATSKAYVATASSILKQAVPETVYTLCVEGGTERQHSIFNALQQVVDVELIAVHDAVRPFIVPEIISRCIKAAAEKGGAVVGVKAKDTIKAVDGKRFIIDTPEREYLWQAQTPQIFKKNVLLQAYTKALEEGFLGTDDASLVERLGHPVVMVEGERDNFKITYPIDLKLATLLLEEQS